MRSTDPMPDRVLPNCRTVRNGELKRNQLQKLEVLGTAVAFCLEFSVSMLFIQNSIAHCCLIHPHIPYLT